MTLTATARLRINYPAMGANPLKDLFVEMDYMPDLLASEELDRDYRNLREAADP